MVVFCTQTLLSSSFFLFVTLLSNLLLKYLLLFFFYPALLAFLSWISTLPYAFIFFLPPVFVLLPLSCLNAPSLHHSNLCSLLISLNYCFYFSYNFRQGDTTWLQLTPYRAGGFPFAHSQPPAFAVVESISTMLLDSPPPSLYLCFCHCYFLFFFLRCTSISFSNFPHYLAFSLSPCLCGPPLGWLLLAAPVPPTLSLDMLFIGLQRGWLSVQGGCCLKQCSLNKRVRSSQRAFWLTRSLTASVYRHRVHHAFPPY